MHILFKSQLTMTVHKNVSNYMAELIKNKVNILRISDDRFSGFELTERDCELQLTTQ